MDSSRCPECGGQGEPSELTNLDDLVREGDLVAGLPVFFCEACSVLWQEPDGDLEPANAVRPAPPLTHTEARGKVLKFHARPVTDTARQFFALAA